MEGNMKSVTSAMSIESDQEIIDTYCATSTSACSSGSRYI